MDNEEKYLDISQKLKNLEPVKASDNFVHNLHSKIVELEAEKRHEHEKRFDEGRGGFLRNLFGNMQYPWLVPAAGFTILIFFVFYITFLNKNATEIDKPLLTDQKQETAEQKNPPTEQNKALDPEENKTLTEKEKLPGKDIASELKTERSNVTPSQTEDQNQFTDRGEEKINKMEMKVAEPTIDEEQMKDKTQPETKADDTKNFAKKESESGRTENNGILATEPPKDEISKSSEPSITRDTDDALKRKATENDSLRKKLDDKLKRINKANLEKIREEILK